MQPARGCPPMTFQLSEILKALGPTASIIFAAWIFMGFLQQRYDAAIDRYRAAISDFRSAEHAPERRDNVREQVLLFKRRCALMGYACLGGLAAAVLFLLTMIAGGVDVIVPDTPVVTVFGTLCALGGFALVIAATVLVIIEASYTHRQLDAELLDVPDLAHRTGLEPGRLSRAPRDRAL
ncbi:hypothetical protein ACVILH_004982 [Bradyrhizobium sp. USDA 4353]